jgi:hypothetical protein
MRPTELLPAAAVRRRSSHLLGDNKSSDNRSVLGRLGKLLRRSKRNSDKKEGVPPVDDCPITALRKRAGSQAPGAAPPVGKAYSYAPRRSSSAAHREKPGTTRLFSEVLPGTG